MRLTLMILAAVAVVAHAKLPSMNPRLLSSALRIHRLEHEIEHLEHAIKDAAKIDPLGFILEMHDRLDLVEGKFHE